MNRLGKIVYYDTTTGRGALTDDTYPEKLYKFVVKGYQAGQYVLYTTTNLNPITGHRDCDLIAPKLYEGNVKFSNGGIISGGPSNDKCVTLNSGEHLLPKSVLDKIMEGKWKLY